MKHLHFMRLAAAALALATLSTGPAPVAAAGQQPAAAAPHTYLVFVASRQIGQETVTIARADGGGWLVHGSNRLAPPVDVVLRSAEIRYDESWHPTQMALSGVIRGQEASVKTTFANGQASSEILVVGTPPSKTDAVTSDTIVLPNAFLGSYAVLARRLAGQQKGAVLHGYIAPAGEIAMRVEDVLPERIETPKAVIPATRYALVVSNPPPGGDIRMSVWTDSEGTLLRMNVPAQTLDMAREDVASAATRTTAFSIPGDENVRIPASGFSLAASVAKPPNAQGKLPAIIVIGGAGPLDRDGIVAGIPVVGQIAAELVKAGFLVVRYDKRGVGQSGGRTETTTIGDYAEDVRSVISWLEDRRKDVDKKRIGLVGHSEGAWIALTVAARDKRVGAVAMLAGASTTGSELVLEQQRHVLDAMKASDADRQAKIELQKQINDAALSGSGWDAIPPDLRRAADSPWFQSFLAFDPVKMMKDVRQPLLIMQGEVDQQVEPHHADRLAELARGRKTKADVEIVKIPGVNHLLVPAKTGEIDEYVMLEDKKVAAAATSAISAFMTKELSAAKK